jgi:hypothetical protein
LTEERHLKALEEAMVEVAGKAVGVQPSVTR